MLISTIFNICPLHLDGWEAPLQTAFKVQPATVSTVSETAPETAETGETGRRRWTQAKISGSANEHKKKTIRMRISFMILYMIVVNDS